MPRKSAMWLRTGRGWYTTIGGRQIKLGDDKREAEKEFARLMLAGGDLMPNVKVAELTQLWLDDVKATRKESTWKMSRQFSRIWCKRFGRLRAGELKPLHIAAWLNSQSTWGRNTRAIAARTIRTCFWWAVDQGYLESNPLKRLRVPQTERRTPITEKQLTDWMAHIQSPELRLWVEVALATGCRPGEIASLNVSHVVRDGDSSPHAARVVGKEGDRIIPLSESASRLLKPLIEGRESGPLLRSPMGRRWNTASLTWHFRNVSEASGISVVPYHLRGVFATRSLRVNGEVLTAKLMGHKNLGMIFHHYEGLDFDDLRAAAEKVNTPRPRA